jgi:5-methylcytosine-specific restriction enzyme B
MLEQKGNRFTQYFAPLLDALRTSDPSPMRPAAVRAWIRSKIDVPAEDLARFIRKGKEAGQQSIFENDVHWARFYVSVRANHLFD